MINGDHNDDDEAKSILSGSSKESLITSPLPLKNACIANMSLLSNLKNKMNIQEM